MKFRPDKFIEKISSFIPLALKESTEPHCHISLLGIWLIALCIASFVFLFGAFSFSLCSNPIHTDLHSLLENALGPLKMPCSAQKLQSKDELKKYIIEISAPKIEQFQFRSGYKKQQNEAKHSPS